MKHKRRVGVGWEWGWGGILRFGGDKVDGLVLPECIAPSQEVLFRRGSIAILFALTLLAVL